MLFSFLSCLMVVFGGGVGESLRIVVMWVRMWVLILLVLVWVLIVWVK